MADLVQDRLAELHRLNDGGEPAPAVVAAPEPPVEPQAETPDPNAPAAAVQPQPRALSLDDPLPEVDDLPPTLRGKPLRELIEDRRRSIEQRDTAGKVKNDYESENTVLKNLLSMMMENQGRPPQSAPVQQPAPVARETVEDRIRREQLGTIVGADPDLALGRTVEIARDELLPELKNQIDPVAKRVEMLERTERDRAVNAAYDRAGAMLKRDPGQWRSDAEIQTMSSAVTALNLPADDPQSYVKADEWLSRLVSARAPKPAPAPTPAPVATAPPPPVGTGAPAAPVENTKPALSARDADMVARVAKQFPNLKREQVEELALRTLGQRQAR